MIYSIKAIDKFFFRSSLPFDMMGETHLLASHFPPYPSTYAGAFKVLGNNPKRMRISYNGVALSEGNDITYCFPQPLDTVILPDKKLEENIPIELEKMQLVNASYSNTPLVTYLTPKSDEKKKPESYVYLNQAELEKYLSDVERVDGFSLKNYFSEEMKIGIGIDSSTDTTEEGKLYQIKMLRPHPQLQLAVEVKGIEAENGHVRLGGEGKVAQIKSVASELTIAAPVLNEKSRYFKLYFATPAIFKWGWRPSWIEENMTGSFPFKQNKTKQKKIEFKLLSATVGKYESVGGFDPIKKQPKELRYAVPAGSVYYFEILGDSTIEDVKKMFHQKCLSDYREGEDLIYNEPYGFSRPKKIFDRIVYCDRGFGYALVGAVNKEQEKVLKCLKTKN